MRYETSKSVEYAICFVRNKHTCEEIHNDVYVRQTIFYSVSRGSIIFSFQNQTERAQSLIRDSKFQVLVGANILL